MAWWGNESSLPEDDRNFSSSGNLLPNDAEAKVLLWTLSLLLLCAIGLAGNLLVMAVYFRQTTTSTRVYMFALAVVDAITCVCGIVWTSVPLENDTVGILYWFVHTSIFFSVLLLAFVAFERLLAVMRPHRFTLSASRAIKALAVIAVAAAGCATMLELPNFLRRDIPHIDVLPMSVVVFSLLLMVVCYVTMALTMLKIARTTRRQIGATFTTRSCHQTMTTASTSLQTDFNAGTTSGCKTVTPSALCAAKGTLTTAKLANTYKSVSLLFVVTLVFLLCWLPQFLHIAGVSLPLSVRLMLILNSCMNPFIYSVASAMFRHDVRDCYRRTRSRLTACGD